MLFRFHALDRWGAAFKPLTYAPYPLRFFIYVITRHQSHDTIRVFNRFVSPISSAVQGEERSREEPKGEERSAKTIGRGTLFFFIVGGGVV